MRIPLLAAVALTAATLAQSDAPSIVIVNARVFTGVGAAPWAEAVAITGDRISLVGSSADVRARAGAATRVIDAGGRVVVPGINDAHIHIGAYPSAVGLDGPPAVEHDPSLDEVLTRLRAAVAKAAEGQWIEGEIGAAVLDDVKTSRAALDAVAPSHPVVLMSWTGHGTVFNSAALRALGVADDIADPPGGRFLRAPDSRAINGVAHEYAEFILRRRMIGVAGRDAQVAELARVGAVAARRGITSMQLMSTSMATPEVVTAVQAARMPQRVRVIDFPMTGIAAWTAPASRTAPGGEGVTVSGTKWVLDGTPVERLMYLREPYADRPDTRGAANFTQAELEGFLRAARAAGEQPMVHAVGDATIDMVLDALERTGGEAWRPLRPRLEHGDMLEPGHFARARRFGVVLVQNPAHMMLDASARLGPRTARTWMVRQAAEAGVPVALGSDGPLNPWLNIMFATISAGNPAGALTREQALAAYTSGAAFAEMAEPVKGVLAPGMLADLAMLSQDIFAVPITELPNTGSVLTIVGGRIVHEQVPPAEVFSPGVISDEKWQWRLTFTPDGRTAYFSESDGFFPASRQASIYVSHLRGGVWSAPDLAPFSGTHSDMDPFVTPDGRRLYFSSIRPDGGAAKPDLDLWMVEKRGDGWSGPVRLGPEVNTEADELYASASSDGTLYFASGPIAPAPGKHWDIYRARPSGAGFAAREPLGPAINTQPSAADATPVAAWEFNPEISADGTLLVFASLRPGGLGFGDLYASRLVDGEWTAAVNLGAPVNTAADEYHPTLARDGRRLYFVRRPGAHGDFFVVPTSAVPALRRQ